MKRHLTSCVMEPLEIRALLAHVGPDLLFGNAGTAPAGGLVLTQVTAEGKTFAVARDKVVRLNENGTIDQTFVDRGGVEGQDIRQAFTGAGRLYIAGWTSPFGNPTWYVRAINIVDGSVVTGFGTNGRITINPQPADSRFIVSTSYLNDIAVLSDDGLVVSISQSIIRSKGSPSSLFGDVLYKFTAAGTPDSGFGTNGVLVVHTSINDNLEYFPSLTPIPSGGFLSKINTGAWSESIQRRKNDGSLDTTFGTNGTAGPIRVLSGFVSYGDIVLQKDGKMLLPATDSEDLYSDAFIGRLNANGTPDTNFGTGGWTALGDDSAHWAMVDREDRIVGVTNARLYRLSADGTPDTSFDDDGFTPLSLTGAFSGSLDEDAFGRILVGDQDAVTAYKVGIDRVQLGQDKLVHADAADTNDSLSATLSGDSVTVTLNDLFWTYKLADIAGFIVNANGGNDSINIAVNLPVTVNGGDGDDSIVTAGGRDLIYGGWGKDTVDSGANKDVIFGGGQDDSLFGSNGDDIIFGDGGSDSIAGGNDNDRLYGDADKEDSQYERGDGPGDDSLSGNAGNDRCDGQSGNDRVAGNGGRDRLFGGRDDDRIYGGASGDWLYGDVGADQLFGEGGTDRLYADDEERTDVAIVDTLHGNAGNDFFICRDTTHDLLFGDGGHDSGYADASDELTSIEVMQ